MESILKNKVFYCIAMVSWFASGTFVAAAVPEVYTNENFQTATHEKPEFFERDRYGNFYGYTISGRLFSQVNVTNNYNIRLQRFAIDEAFFYISDRGIIYAQSDSVALSIYLTRRA